MTLAPYDRLISSVEAGEYSRVSGHTIRKALGGNYIGWFFDAAKGDMKAALSLKEAVFPGSGWTGEFIEFGPPIHAGLSDRPTVSGITPARALLLAILKAKRSELETDNG